MDDRYDMLTEILSRLADGKKHDPSWIRPIPLSQDERKRDYAEAIAIIAALRAENEAKDREIAELRKGNRLPEQDVGQIQAGTDNPLSPQGKKWSYYHNKKCLKSILNVALDVHMQKSGAYEYGDIRVFLKDISLLRWALKHWTTRKNSEFDSAVHTLITIALCEAEEFCEHYRLDMSELEDEEYFIKEI
jgi:hypothetical protein